MTQVPRTGVYLRSIASPRAQPAQVTYTPTFYVSTPAPVPAQLSPQYRTGVYTQSIASPRAAQPVQSVQLPIFYPGVPAPFARPQQNTMIYSPEHKTGIYMSTTASPQAAIMTSTAQSDMSTHYPGKTKFESCVLQVKEKQGDWCAEHGYKRGTDPTTGKSCYNPWAVCHRSTGM